MEPDGLGLFKVYCLLMTVLYALICIGALALPFLDLGLKTEDFISFGIVGAVSFPMMLAFGYGLVLPRAQWAWVYGIILIALGLGSCCCWPICIPLLIKWIDGDFKAWFEGS